jgi:hypothetical protein
MLGFLAALVMGCGGPFSLWDAHTTSTPRGQSLDVSALAREPVAVLAVMAPAALQGLSPSVSHALSTTLSEATPPIQAIPTHETANRLNEKGLAADYREMTSDFAPGGILDRQRLGRIGAALGVKYVLQPGLAEFAQTLTDRFEIAGWKAVKSRVSVLRLWLQLWDAQAGQILWESAGEVTVASEIVQEQRTVPLNEMAQRLWARMIQDDLLGGRTQSQANPPPFTSCGKCLRPSRSAD